MIPIVTAAMLQNSPIEEIPVLSDRSPVSEIELHNELHVELHHDSETWLDHEITVLTESLRYGDPNSSWVLQSFQTPLKQSTQSSSNTLLRCLQTFDFGYPVRQIVIHPSGEWIATVGSPTRKSQPEETNTIQVWHWRTGKRLFSLEGHTAPIRAIALSSDGKTLVSGSADRTIKVWNFLTGEEITTLTGHNSPITAIAVSATGQTVVSSGRDQYEVRDGKIHTTVRDRALRIWDVARGKVTHILSCTTDAPTLMMAPREEFLLKIESKPEVLNLETGTVMDSLNWLSREERLLAIAPTWKMAATVSGRQVSLYEVATGKVRSQIQLDNRGELQFAAMKESAIQVSALSPDSQCFVAGFQRTSIHPKLGSYLTPQNGLKLWDVQTGDCLSSLSQAELGAGLWQAIEFSPDSRLLVTSVGQTVKVWQCGRVENARV